MIDEGTCIHSPRLAANDHKLNGLCPLSQLQCRTSPSASMSMLASPLAPSLAALMRAIMVALEPLIQSRFIPSCQNLHHSANPSFLTTYGDINKFWGLGPPPFCFH